MLKKQTPGPTILSAFCPIVIPENPGLVSKPKPITRKALWRKKRKENDPQYREKLKQQDKQRGYKRKYVPHVSRTRHLRTRYAITTEEWERLFEYQKGLCAICHKQLRHPNRGQEGTQAYTDHDHRRKFVRGILCYRCNKKLWADESPLRLVAAAEYLTKPPAWEVIYVARMVRAVNPSLGDDLRNVSSS